MTRWLKSSALALLFSSVLPFTAPDLFVYKSRAAESELPSWIVASCCGPQDAHRLRADQVYRNENGTWHADGYPKEIPNDSRVRPSQDGHAWVFYNEHRASDGKLSDAYCTFFVPST
jgi:hypothetical protein